MEDLCKVHIGIHGFVSALEVPRRVPVESTKCSDFNWSEEALPGTRDCRYLAFQSTDPNLIGVWHCWSEIGGRDEDGGFQMSSLGLYIRKKRND